MQKLKLTQQGRDADNSAKKLTNKAGLTLNRFANWNGFDLALDFYRLRNAGQLALADISRERLAHYRLLSPSSALHQAAEHSQQNVIFTKRLGQLDRKSVV